MIGFNLKCSVSIWNALIQFEMLGFNLKCSVSIWNDRFQFEIVGCTLKCSVSIWNARCQFEMLGFNLKCSVSFWNAQFQIEDQFIFELFGLNLKCSSTQATAQVISEHAYKSASNVARCDQARGGQTRILYDDLQTIKSYINPSQGTWPSERSFPTAGFLVCGEVLCNPVWHFLESKMSTKPRPGWENALASANVPNWCFCSVLCPSVHLWQSGMFPCIAFCYCCLFMDSCRAECRFSVKRTHVRNT